MRREIFENLQGGRRIKIRLGTILGINAIRRVNFFLLLLRLECEKNEMHLFFRVY